MSFLDLFDSRDKKKRLSHIRNLIMLALSDGTFDKSEMELITKIGISAGLTPNELQRIFARPDSIDFYPPETYRERIEQLYDMVLVMMVNTEIHENEILICKLIAEKLGFKHTIIDKMVRDTIDMIINGIAFDIAVNELLRNIRD